MPADKLDLFKVHKAEYVMPKKPVLLKTRGAKYLAIDGQGKPGDALFQAQVGALYAVAFTIKMTMKFAGGTDYKVCPLEGLYWGLEETRDIAATPAGGWKWKLLIRVPDFISATHLASAVATLKKKGKSEPVADVTLEKLNEGQSVQMLHVGPYATENATIAEMIDFAKAQGLAPKGAHHEIYLSDPRRVAPERLRTILRQPVG
jgi:hypothetical protein